MKLWLEVIWQAIPRRWVLISLPFVIPGAAFVLWFLFGGFFIEPVPPQQIAYSQELERLKPLVAKGNTDAKLRTALILRDGLAGEKDYARAAKLLNEAARTGNASARLALGNLFETGRGVRQDYGRAAEWYRLAAGFGRHAEAQFALGDLFFYGRGVAHDYAEAISWYRQAAIQGHAGAQAIIGSMYEKGFGIDRDYSEAYVWYTLAAEHPEKSRRYRSDINPVAELTALKGKMSRLQLQTGEERLRKLIKQIRASRRQRS